MNYVIREISQTCLACPAQWEGFLADGRAFYIRYRWGVLSFSVSSSKSNDVSDAVLGDNVYREQIGESLDGFIYFDRVKQLLGEREIILCGELSNE